MANSKLGHVEKAKVDLAQVGITPELTRYLNLQSDIFVSEKKYTEALTSCNKSIALLEGIGSLNRRGYIYYCLGKYAEAIKDYDRAVNLGGSRYIPQYIYKEKALAAIHNQKNK